MNLLLVRHGEVPANVNKVYAGRSNEGLTAKGVTQAKEVAEKLKGCHVHSLFSSPIQRARETAAIIGKKLGLPVVVEQAFREMELGPWEGMSESDVERLFPAEWHVWQNSPSELTLPGRETLDLLLSRALAGVRKICLEAPEITVLIVTHVAIIRVLMLWHSGRSLNQYKTVPVPNAGIFSVTLEGCPSSDCSTNSRL